MPHRNLLVIILVVAFSYVCYVRCEQNPYARYAASSYSMVDEWSWVDVPDDELFAGAVKGMVDVLQRHGDEHSQFITQEDAREFEAEIRQQFGGIGVRIRVDGEPPMPVIVGPPEPGSPAYDSPIRAGDIVTAIDGTSTAGMDLLAILRHMRGEVGAPIELTIQHRGEDSPVQVRLVRAIITVDSILGDTRKTDGSWRFRLALDPRIAYIRIVQFGDKTVGELYAALEKATAKGAEALVLDLRDNAGGALDAAVLACEMFLREGSPIVETRGRDREVRDEYVARNDGRYRDLPIAVLINQYSASASEIVAACLQDNRRAKIIGQQSYGKGTVQQVLHVGSRGTSRLKLTSATYWRPSGVNIHRMPGDSEATMWGVQPDDGFQVKLDEDEYSDYRRWRSDRDLIKVGSDDLTVEANSAAEQEFADRALQRAVTHLQDTLAE